MTRIQLRATILPILLFLSTTPLLALPRDAIAVLNRCGKPLKGDTTVLDNSVAGGHRTLSYERGTLHFDKVALDGWTFTSGDHGRKTQVNAAEMEAYLPCLKDALADSAAPQPIQPISSTTRIETSLKRDFRQILLIAFIAILLAGLILLLLSRRSRQTEVELE